MSYENREELEARILQLEKLWDSTIRTNRAGLSSGINLRLVKLRLELEKYKDNV